MNQQSNDSQISAGLIITVVLLLSIGYAILRYHEMSIANSTQKFDDDEITTDQELEERLLNIGRQVVKFVAVQQRIQQDEFMKMWKTLPTW